ncbi:hypothetical protein CSKR_105793, partial [Clonorchis sinensis]
FVDNYTHLQINLVFTADSTISLVCDILQLNVLHKGRLMFQLVPYSRYQSVSEGGGLVVICRKHFEALSPPSSQSGNLEESGSISAIDIDRSPFPILSPAKRMDQWLERKFTDRKVCGSNPTSASRLPLSRLGQPGSIPALMLPSGGMAVKHRKGVTAE